MAFKVSFINKKTNVVSRNNKPGIFILLGFLSILSACAPDNSDWCIEADDWGDTINKTVIVNAKDQFTPTGINLTKGKPLDIKISGVVDLCPTSNIKNISPAVSGWQDSGIDVNVDDASLDIRVSSNSSYIDVNNIEQKYGKGLYAYILPIEKGASPAQLQAAIAAADINHPMWYGAALGNNASLPASNNERIVNGTCASGAGKCNFFELYKDGVSGYSDKVPVSGRLLFRYARSPEQHGISNSGDGEGRYSPWRGKYKWRDRCDACRQSVIFGSCAAFWVFGPLGYGVCVAGWQIGCSADNSTEMIPSDQIARNPNCQEFDNGLLNPSAGGYWGNNFGDHWVNENFDSTTYNDGNGYQLNIQHGCQGTLGKYMQMDVPLSVAYVTNPVPPPCPDGYSAAGQQCINTTDNTLLTATTPQLAHQPCAEGSPCDLNSSGVSPNGNAIGIPPAFSAPTGRPGHYNGFAPYNGELWLEIVDSKTEANEAHPQGGYYADNIGSYKVTIKTQKVLPVTDILNVVIRPLKHIIYGYCQNGYNPNPNGVSAPSIENYTETQCIGTYGSVGIINTDTAVIPMTSSACPNDYLPSQTQMGKCECVGDSCMYVGAGQMFSAVNAKCPTGYKLSTAIQGQCECNDVKCMPSQNDKYAVSYEPLKWKPGITQFMYNKLIDSPLIVDGVRSALVLLVVVYGMLFMMGMIEEPVPHFIGRLVRAAVVIQLISPGSWQFFNQYLFTFFIDGMNQLISIVSSDFMGVAILKGTDGATIVSTIDNPFMFADRTLGMFLSPQTWAKMFGLLFSSPIGFIYIILIIVGMVYFIKALLKAAILYVLSMLVIALVLILAPIFITFLLFDSTRGYFRKWIHTLINYLFQPILVFAALAIFNMFVYSALYTMLHFRVCWQHVLHLKIGELISMPIFDFFLPDAGYTAYGAVLGGNSGSPIGLFLILIFVIIANMMWKLVDFMSELVSNLTVADRDASISSAANRMTDKISGGAFSIGASAVRHPGQAMKKAGKAAKAARSPVSSLGNAAGNAAKNQVKSALGMKKDNKK